MSTAEPIDLVLPVFNEADSIGEVLNEFHRVVSIEQHQPLRFVVSEDGSTDNSAGVIRALAAALPIHLLSAPGRKGYSKAVVDGFRVTTSSLVSFIDSDGQCDPRDFSKLFAHVKDNDLVVGYRAPRNDPFIRILMSTMFGLVYHAVIGRSTKDPSCPYLIIKRPALDKLMRGNLGILKQGFWWEFIARARSAGLKIHEVPVNHRQRIAGKTRVYRWSKIPRIAWEHILGLFELRKELRSGLRNA